MSTFVLLFVYFQFNEICPFLDPFGPLPVVTGLLKGTYCIPPFREAFNKKNWKKAVRLTAWVDPPLPSPEAVRKM